MKTNGPGKYDDACTEVRELLNAAGVVLMVFEGSRGSGFEVQMPPLLVPMLPTMLRLMADGIEADNRKNADA